MVVIKMLSVYPAQENHLFVLQFQLRNLRCVAGNIKLSPLASAQALATALTIHKLSMNTLRKVTVVLYESSTVQTFSKVLKTLGKQDTPPLPRNPDKDVPKKSFFQRALGEIMMKHCFKNLLIHCIIKILLYF